jgi:hypothetical protein
VETGVPELQRQHRHVQPRALRRLRRHDAGGGRHGGGAQATHVVAHDRITRNLLLKLQGHERGHACYTAS